MNPGKDELRPWGVRPFLRGDMAQLPHADAFAADHFSSASAYAWRLFKSPASVGVPNVWYADTGNDIVGQYASAPQPFKLGHQRLHVLHGEYTWLATAYSEQPIIREIATVAIDAWRSADVPFVWRLQDSKGTNIVSGWQRLHACCWLWYPLRLGAYLRLHDMPGTISALGGGVGTIGNLLSTARMRWNGRRIKIEPVGQLDERFDRLCDRLADEYQALTIRNAEWLTYRYRQEPETPFQIWLASHDDEPTGYIITHLTEKNGVKSAFIVDLFAARHDERSRSALLRTATAFCRRAGALAVYVLLLRKSHLERWFRRLGFLKRGGTNYVEILPLRSDMPNPTLRDAENWHLMFGDFDPIIKGW